MTRVKHELEEEEELKEVDAQGMPVFVARQLSDEDQQARTHPPAQPAATGLADASNPNHRCVRSCAYVGLFLIAGEGDAAGSAARLRACGDDAGVHHRVDGRRQADRRPDRAP